MLRFFAAAVQTLAIGALLASAAPAAAQQAYPSKPIRFIVPYPPGGSNNVLARLVGQKLTDSWGQQVIIDNRGGGNSVIGSEALLKSLPDGYTILLINSTHSIIPSLIANLPYDTFRDFAPVATIGSSEFILVLHPSVPASTLQEFITLAKSNSIRLNLLRRAAARWAIWRVRCSTFSSA